jgi:hypothetical protein
MNEEQQEAYNEGNNAYWSDTPEHCNPYETGYAGALGEFWSDGWSDAEEDHKQ